MPDSLVILLLYVYYSIHVFLPNSMKQQTNLNHLTLIGPLGVRSLLPFVQVKMAPFYRNMHLAPRLSYLLLPIDSGHFLYQLPPVSFTVPSADNGILLPPIPMTFIINLDPFSHTMLLKNLWHYHLMHSQLMLYQLTMDRRFVLPIFLQLFPPQITNDYSTRDYSTFVTFVHSYPPYISEVFSPNKFNVQSLEDPIEIYHLILDPCVELLLVPDSSVDGLKASCAWVLATKSARLLLIADGLRFGYHPSSFCPDSTALTYAASFLKLFL